MGRGSLESLRRGIVTVFIMVIMVGSLLTCSGPVLVAVMDVILPCTLLSSLTYCNLKISLSIWTFHTDCYVRASNNALDDCYVRAGVYSVFDAPGAFHGPYLCTAVSCGLLSGVIITVKACLFTVSCTLQSPPAEARSFHLKHSWGMTAMFLSSMILAFGHIAVAYRIRCKARHKQLVFHRLDPEAVLACKAVFHGFQNVSSSPTRTVGKMAKANCKGKFFDGERGLSAKMLADVDSLFMLCEGLVVHYKIVDGKSWNGSLTSSSFHDSRGRNKCIMTERLRFDNGLGLPPKDVSLTRSFSQNLRNESLYAPLLSGSRMDVNPVFNHSFKSCSGLTENRLVSDLEKYKHDEFGSPRKLSKTRQQKTGSMGVVLIHGFGGGVFSWRHVMSPLESQTGCTVAAFDRPGWGLTSRPSRVEWEEKGLPNPYELYSQVGLLFSFCQDLGFSSVVLVGHDDGGLLALMAAERMYACKHVCKVKVKGVVLVGASLSRETMPPFAQTLLHTSLGQNMLHPLLRTEICQVANRRGWYDASKLTMDVLDLYKAPLCVEGWDKALIELSKLSTSRVLSPKNASELLKVVQDLPILIAAGAEDILVPLKSAQALAYRLPNSRIVAISGCGHFPHEERPAALLAALVPFVSELYMGSSSQDFAAIIDDEEQVYCAYSDRESSGE
eukprot:Gb_28413 [translate_table: standard]